MRIIWQSVRGSNEILGVKGLNTIYLRPLQVKLTIQTNSNKVVQVIVILCVHARDTFDEP